MPDVKNYFKLKTESFKAGQISIKLTEWQKITSDTEVHTMHCCWKKN